MEKELMLIILLSLSLFSCGEKSIESYRVIPYPQECSYVPGQFRLNKNVKISASGGLLKDEAEMLKEYLNEDYDVEAQLVSEGEPADIILKKVSDCMFKKEEYALDVTTKGIEIKGATNVSLFYGIQTLRQMIFAKGECLVVQKGCIHDFPAFSWRAFMLDEGRNFKGKKEVKQLLNEMARLKMNIFHWHLTDDQGWRIEIKKYPKLTEVGAFRDSTQLDEWKSEKFDTNPHFGFYTQEDIREIVQYAQARHIQIVPEIEMPGHSSAAIAAYPWLGTIGKPIKVLCRFGTELDLYNIADQKVIEFLDDVLGEVIELFPSPIIHVGGDEVRFSFWESSPYIQNYMKKNNLNSPAELQVHFTNEISHKIKEKGRRMMGWNDITGAQLHEYNNNVKDASNDKKLAEGTIVHFWKGDDRLILNTIEKGYDVVNSYHEYTYLNYDYGFIPLKKAYSFNPIPEGLPDSLNNHVLGIGCQMWGEFINTVEKMNYKIYPRIAAYAEVGWTLLPHKDYDRFRSDINNLMKSWDKEGIKYGPLDTTTQ